MGDAEQLRARGNALYSEGRFEEARALYDQAIEALAPSLAEAQSRSLIAQLYSNRAQTFVQERSFALALQDAVRALEYDPENEKAQLRRLVALENLERFETALQLVETVLDNVESRTKHRALFDYAIAARWRLRKNLQQDKLAAKQESHAIGRMVHDNQKLRINFGCLIPSRVAIGEFFDVSVNIGNEFGLFRRDYLRDSAPIKLQCELRNNLDNSLRLVFRTARSTASTSALDDSDGNAPTDGVVTLNDRGKAHFQLAIVFADSGLTRLDSRPDMTIGLFVHSDSAVRWNLLPVVSLPFSLVASPSVLETMNEEPLDSVSSSLGIHCCRPVWLPSIERELLLAESPGNLGIGGKLWDSCLVLTRYLSRHSGEIHGKTVLELGSGLGLVGMFCGLLGAKHVTLTDIDEVVPLLAYNIRLNFRDEGQPSLAAVPHFWGTSIESLPVQYPEVLVLSDVVYDPEGYVPLVASLNALSISSATTVFMAHRSRNPMEHLFFELLAQTFEYEQVDWSTEESDLRSQAGASSPEGKDEHTLQDVKIFRIVRRA